MKRVISLAALAALGANHQALAVGSMADVTIVDRETGSTLSTHYSRGEYWVAGRPGARYAIEIRNRAGGRLLAVTSVDGVNVLSGANAGWDQSGYVFAPGQAYQITGWRKSNAEVAAFTFTDASNSYAGRTGRPANIGVIGVALFRERPSEPLVARPITPAAPMPPAADSRGESALESLASAAPGPRAERAPASGSPAVPEAKLGTGHGEREYSYVEDTEFQRLRKEPNEVIRIRYDSLENLVAMGVLRRARPVPPGPNPFPDSPGRSFVPDPPG